MKYGKGSTLGQDLESQIRSLEAEGCEKIYTNKFTGTKTDRPKFNKVLKILKGGDTLVVLTQLNGFARITTDRINTVKKLFEHLVKVLCAEHWVNRGYTDRSLQKYAFKGKEKAINTFV